MGDEGELKRLKLKLRKGEKTGLASIDLKETTYRSARYLP